MSTNSNSTTVSPTEIPECMLADKECQVALAFTKTARGILSYEQSFMRPLLEKIEDVHGSQEITAHV